MNDLVFKLAELEGYDDPMEMLAEAVADSVVPAICSNCNATYDLEPDAIDCHCDNCGENKVSSCLHLAGLI